MTWETKQGKDGTHGQQRRQFWSYLRQRDRIHLQGRRYQHPAVAGSSTGMTSFAVQSARSTPEKS